MMVRKFLQIITCTCMLACVSCSSRNADDTDIDLEFVQKIGHQYASTYRSMQTTATELELQDFILDVKARSYIIEHDIGTIYSEAFLTAFSDSAFVSE